MAKGKRKCSICRMPGHTKRTCLYRNVQEQAEKEKALKKRHVLVRVNEKMMTSPHVVNLKNNQNFKLDEMPVYSENAAKKEERVEVDFAKMVNAANKKLENEKFKVKSSNEKVDLLKMINELQKTPVKKKEYKTNKKQNKKKISNYFNNFFSDVAHDLNQARENIANAFTIKKFAYGLIALLIVGSVPFPAIGYYIQVKKDSNRIVEESTNAFLALQSSTVAAMQSNIEQAKYDLNAALESFGNAEYIIDQEHKALVYVASMLPVVGKHLESRQMLLSAGHHLALGNTYLVKGISTAEREEEMPLTGRLQIFCNHINSAIPQYNQALEELAKVESSVVPAEYQQSFDDFKLLFAAFIDDLKDFSALGESLQTIFGEDDFRRYLVLFQNNHELRPSGGFMGSFAIVDVQKGKIVNIDIPGGGTYDVQGQLDTYLEPPLPLQLMNKRWEFQDANWFPDFAATAEKSEWFIEHSRGVTVDGVIAVNASVVERLLRVLGPIENEEYEVLLSADNVLQTLQQEVEIDYDKQKNQPKKILSSVLEQMIGQLGNIDQQSIVQLVNELHEAVAEKEIQVYMKDKKIQKKLSEYGWTGEILNSLPTQDYLAVVFANLHGQKTDAKIDQEIDHKVFIQEDGSIINKVKIKRTHNGKLGEKFYGVNNVGYIRLYVPEGSELLDVNGFQFPPEEVFQVPEEWYKQDVQLLAIEKEEGIHIETGTRITREFGKTVFGNWIQLPPGGTQEIEFIYRLPFRIKTEEQEVQVVGFENAEKWKDFFSKGESHASRYSLILQKQSGSNSHYSFHINYPDGWETMWTTNEKIKKTEGGASFELDLKEDNAFGVVMEKS